MVDGKNKKFKTMMSEDFKQKLIAVAMTADKEGFAKRIADLFREGFIDLKTLLKEAMAYGENHPHWTSVGEELPHVEDDRATNLGEFLLYTEAVDRDGSFDGHYRTGFYNLEKGYWEIRPNRFGNARVTHWLRLPEPPKKDEVERTMAARNLCESILDAIEKYENSGEVCVVDTINIVRGHKQNGFVTVNAKLMGESFTNYTAGRVLKKL